MQDTIAKSLFTTFLSKVGPPDGMEAALGGVDVVTKAVNEATFAFTLSTAL